MDVQSGVIVPSISASSTHSPSRRDHPVPIDAVTRLDTLAHGHRHECAVSAEARIDDEAGAIELHGQEHVRAWSLVARPDGDNPRGMRGGTKAQALDRRVKQRAVLEAVAAAAIDDQLSGDAVEVDADAAAEQHVHVLERECSRCARASDRRASRAWARPAHRIRCARDRRRDERHGSDLILTHGPPCKNQDLTPV